MADKQQNPAGEDQPATPDEQPRATSAAAESAESAASAQLAKDAKDAKDAGGVEGAKVAKSAGRAKATKAAKASKATEATKSAKAAKKTTANAAGTQRSTSKATRAPEKARPRPAKKATAATPPSEPAEATRAEGPAPAEAAETTPTSETPPPMHTPPAAGEPEAAVVPTATAPAAQTPAPPQVAPPTPAAPEMTVTPAGPPAPGAWMEAAWDSVWHADEPPQRLAELTVAELGPRAAAWLAWLRETYPAASADGIVRLATEQSRRHGWTLAAVDAAGPLAAAVHMPASAGVRAMLVLRIAAAHGHDPADPARVPELLTLLGYDGREGSPLGRWGPAWYALTRLGRRRPTPTGLLRVLSAVSDQRDGLLRLAHQAARHYRSRDRDTGTALRAAS